MVGDDPETSRAAARVLMKEHCEGQKLWIESDQLVPVTSVDGARDDAAEWRVEYFCF